MCIHIYIYTNMYILIHTHLYMCNMCVYIYIYIYTHIRAAPAARREPGRPRQRLFRKRYGEAGGGGQLYL